MLRVYSGRNVWPSRVASSGQYNIWDLLGQSFKILVVMVRIMLFEVTFHTQTSAGLLRMVTASWSVNKWGQW